MTAQTTPVLLGHKSPAQMKREVNTEGTREASVVGEGAIQKQQATTILFANTEYAGMWTPCFTA